MCIVKVRTNAIALRSARCDCPVLEEPHQEDPMSDTDVETYSLGAIASTSTAYRLAARHSARQ